MYLENIGVLKFYKSASPADGSNEDIEAISVLCKIDVNQSRMIIELVCKLSVFGGACPSRLRFPQTS